MASPFVPSGSAPGLQVQPWPSVVVWEDEDCRNRNPEERTSQRRLVEPLPEAKALKAFSLHLQNQAVLRG